MKKYIFEIIWLVTILVVVVQMVLFFNREDLPEGLIIIEQSDGNDNSVHLARVLNQRYLPSSANSLNVNDAAIPSITKKAPKQFQIEKAEDEPSHNSKDPLRFDFTSLPSTQYSLKLSSNGEFEEIATVDPSDEASHQVVENSIIELAPLSRIHPDDDLQPDKEIQDQPLN